MTTALKSPVMILSLLSHKQELSGKMQMVVIRLIQSTLLVHLPTHWLAMIQCCSKWTLKLVKSAIRAGTRRPIMTSGILTAIISTKCRSSAQMTTALKSPVMILSLLSHKQELSGKMQMVVIRLIQSTLLVHLSTLWLAMIQCCSKWTLKLVKSAIRAGTRRPIMTSGILTAIISTKCRSSAQMTTALKSPVMILSLLSHKQELSGKMQMVVIRLIQSTLLVHLSTLWLAMIQCCSKWTLKLVKSAIRAGTRRPIMTSGILTAIISTKCRSSAQMTTALKSPVMILSLLSRRQVLSGKMQTVVIP
ncbi:hypothetical protein Z947_402 [Sulfitobacter geojensis]|nr:hypothetical protein Z947_402 [Sulfitobacter geojensis]